MEVTQELAGPDGWTLVATRPLLVATLRLSEGAEFFANRLVQEAGKRAIKIVNGDQLDHIGKIAIGSAQVAQPAGDFRLDQ